VDGADQTEVWSVFRAARMARARLERADDDGRAVTVTASHDGYRRLPGRLSHRRTWSVSPGAVTITDEIHGTGDHTAESHIRLAAPGVAKVAWTAPAGIEVTEGPARYATGFGQLHDGHLVSASWRGRVPVSLRLELHVEGEVLQGSEPGTHDAETPKGTQ
jgi:hypothetical protein